MQLDKEKGIQIAKILKALIELNKVAKILDSFLPVFLNKTIPKNDRVWLHGSFNLGGTVSGRPSSTNPNMLNLPSSGSIYAKPVKQCFSAGEGWLLVGADYASLEDRISALTTKDPNKIRVYTEGYCGHCLRASYYFKDQLTGIEDTVDSINSIQDKYPKLRQKSKAPTFALTYQGTWHTLVNSCGFKEDEAKSIETAYHELYKISDEWVQSKLRQASKDGYVTCAFGLRVRTPILSQILYGKKMPYEASAEGRTAGNALGQSWSLLNNRAQNAFMKKVYQSEYRLDIHPISGIYDANYFLIRNDPKVLQYVNDNLIPEMEWNNHPDIYHPEVGLGGNLEIFYPSWAESTKVPNKASLEEIEQILQGLNNEI